MTTLTPAGRLTEIVEDLLRCLALALAEDPRGVICDLASTTDGADSGAGELLGSSGRYLQEWPGISVAFCCPKDALRRRLLRQSMDEHVIVRANAEGCLSVMDRRVAPRIARLRLDSHPTASRLARDFVTRTCLDWGLIHEIGSACLVVSEFVTNVVQHAATDMDVSVALCERSLRVAVRDRSSAMLQPRRRSLNQVNGRGITLVNGFSRAWGMLPAHDGKVAWAVLDA